MSPSLNVTIDWSQAPEWAHYAAMDEDGEWWFFEEAPRCWQAAWVSNSGRGRRIDSGIEWAWRESLVKREAA